MHMMERSNASVRAGLLRRVSEEVARQEDVSSVAMYADPAIREKAACTCG